MQAQDLEELLVDELKDLYSAEKQLLKALPRMAKKASNPELKRAFETHLRETEGQVKRLEQVFEKLGQKPKAKTCKAMEGLLEEGKEILEADMADDVRDAAMIGAAQKVEHYEIAGYGTLRTFATVLGRDDVAALLQKTLDEEGATDKKLTALAESGINLEAADGDEDDE